MSSLVPHIDIIFFEQLSLEDIIAQYEQSLEDLNGNSITLNKDPTEKEP